MPNLGGPQGPPRKALKLESTSHASDGEFTVAQDVDATQIWGFLISVDGRRGSIALGKPPKCGSSGRSCGSEHCQYCKGEDDDGRHDGDSIATGYLLGRSEECDIEIDMDDISCRHCVIYKTTIMEDRISREVSMCQDMSSNGTFINGLCLGRNARKVLNNGDHIGLAKGVDFLFRYPHNRQAVAFHDKFKVGKLVGKGHFAEVRHAIDRATGEKYAVKIFQRDSSKRETRRAGLQQEIALLMSITHPNILCLREVYDEDEEINIVMELFAAGKFVLIDRAKDGELFDLIVERGKFSEDECRRIFGQLLEGLQYLHDRHVVHRDVKPENILIADKESLLVRLGDFGLAKIVGEDSFTTALCGTPSYVAPEMLAEPAQRQYGKPVDVWSLGVCLYIALCGFPPFSEQLAPPSMSEQIKTGRYVFPRPYFDTVSDDALDLVEQMLEVDALKRITVRDALKHSWMQGKVGRRLRSSALKRDRVPATRQNSTLAESFVQEEIRRLPKSLGKMANEDR